MGLFIEKISYLLTQENVSIPMIGLKGSMNGQKSPNFTETCRFGKDTMLSRMFQVMEKFHINGCCVAEDTGLDYTVATRRMKAYSFTTRNGRSVPQIILQGNRVEQWGFEIGCSVSV